MENKAISNRELILEHSVTLALTPLIPIPFADDIVANAIRRRLVRKLGVAHGLDLGPYEVRGLADQPGRTLGRIARRVITYPVRKILRKIFFVLELRRALAILGEDYHRAILLDDAFSSGWVRKYPPHILAEAVDRTLAAMPLDLFDRAVRASFSMSRGAILQAVDHLTRRHAAGSSGPAPEEELLEKTEARESSPLTPLIAQLGRIVDKLPADHLPKLVGQLERELAWLSKQAA